VRIEPEGRSLLTRLSQMTLPTNRHLVIENCLPGSELGRSARGGQLKSSLLLCPGPLRPTFDRLAPSREKSTGGLPPCRKMLKLTARVDPVHLAHLIRIEYPFSSTQKEARIGDTFCFDIFFQPTPQTSKPSLPEYAWYLRQCAFPSDKYHCKGSMTCHRTGFTIRAILRIATPVHVQQRRASSLALVSLRWRFPRKFGIIANNDTEKA
jgi:hypothetical protein